MPQELVSVDITWKVIYIRVLVNGLLNVLQTSAVIMVLMVGLCPEFLIIRAKDLAIGLLTSCS